MEEKESLREQDSKKLVYNLLFLFRKYLKNAFFYYKPLELLFLKKLLEQMMLFLENKDYNKPDGFVPLKD